MFENWVLRRISGPKKDKVIWEWWKKKHNEELVDLYSSPNIFLVIKLRMRWEGHVAHMGERRGVHRVCWRNMRSRDHPEDPAVDGRIILRWIVRKWNVGVWIESSWLAIGTGGGHL
jgi:hypothetical protein